jgi:hypothetical protein
MLKYYCDVCGAEVWRGGSPLTARYFRLGIEGQSPPAPAVQVMISVESRTGDQDNTKVSRATCDNCIHDAVVISLGLPAGFLKGPGNMTKVDPKGI